MTNVRRTNFEVVGGLILSACCITSTWWLMRNNTVNAVKDAKAEKDKEHAEDLRRVEEQRQKEFQMFRSIIDSLLNNKEKV